MAQRRKSSTSHPGMHEKAKGHEEVEHDGPPPETSSPTDRPGDPDSPEIGTTGDDDLGSQPEWPDFLSTATEREFKERLAQDLGEVASLLPEALGDYHVLLLLEPRDSIDDFELDQIYQALSASEPRSKNILLILLSGGGRIEPAYRIAKICKAYARDKFVVAVPRQAKSAATLISLGADEIHMGPLGHLGPIDPQLDGLPALGVSQALKAIASFVEERPGSAEMFARYLRMAVTVEQIGYSERVSESAAQYAVRLLSTKAHLIPTASKVAHELVYEYKDHGFVIDLEEAQRHLGETWIRTGTLELELAERLYRYFDWISLFFGVRQSKRFFVVGSLAKPTIIVFQNR